MPIRTQSADGVTHEFPDETAPDVVDKAMKTYADEQKNKTTTLGQMGEGFMDPVIGGAQLGAHVLDSPLGAMIPGGELAKRALKSVDISPSQTMDTAVQEREAAIAKERGGEAGNFDWARTAGSMLNPLNYLGGGLVSGAGKVANVGRAIAGGTAAGAVSPAISEDFPTEKGKQAWMGATIGTLFGLGGAAASRGIEKVGEFVARKYPEAIENEAVRKILKRMSQDEKYGGPTATDAIDLINNAKKPVTLTDVGGSNVKGLAGNVARQPGESKQIAGQFLEKRDNEAAQRLSADIAEHVTSGPTAHQATEAMLQARSVASRPLYDDVHDLQKIWSPRLQRFLDDPAIKSGMSRGWEIERVLSVAEDRPLSTTQMGVDLDVMGNIKLVDKPNMRLLDMGKRGLDAMIADERDAITGRLSAKGVALDKMRRAYVDTLDNLDTSGVYCKARQTWAGYSQSMDAVKLGKTTFGRSAEENEKLVAEMSASDREFVRIGLADQLKERLGKTGFTGDEAKSLIKNPWMRDQMRPFFKSLDEYNAFVDAVTAERQMFETGRKVLGGSQTAEREAEDSGMKAMGGYAQAAMEAARLHILRAARTTWKTYHDLGLKPNPELNAKISQILFTTEFPKDSRVAQKLTGELPLGPVANPDMQRGAKEAAGVLGGALRTMGSAQQPMQKQQQEAPPLEKRSDLGAPGEVLSDEGPDPVRPGAQYAMMDDPTRAKPPGLEGGGPGMGVPSGAGAKKVVAPNYGEKVAGQMAGVSYKVTPAQHEEMVAARKAGAGKAEIQKMVDRFQGSAGPKTGSSGWPADKEAQYRKYRLGGTFRPYDQNEFEARVIEEMRNK